MTIKNNILIAGASALGVMAGSAWADQVIVDDLIVQGSICAGQDCVNGESFGFDTLRLKENNLRIKAQDTSNSASFPTRDWQITFNDSSNGGANKFSIDDIDGGRTPFTIEAGARTNALYVDDGGRIGVGTATPVANLHAVTGNTPTLRLEQDGSSGFTAQTFDVASNEANFFIRDATNGSTLPFRIEPSSPSNMLYLDRDNEIGMGTTSPDGALHISRSDGANVDLILQQTSGATASKWILRNNGSTGRMTFRNDSTGLTPFKFGRDAVENLFRVGIVDNDVVDINGTLKVSNSCMEIDNLACTFSAGGVACAVASCP